MKKGLGPLAGAALLALASPIAAQDTSNADVLAVVDTFFEGLNTADSDKMRSVIDERAMIFLVVEPTENPSIRARTVDESLAGLLDGGTYYERYWEPTVLVGGPVAVVWAPYLFDNDGQRSHCGIDVFNLLRVEDEWKITGIQYSVEPEGCPAAR